MVQYNLEILAISIAIFGIVVVILIPHFQLFIRRQRAQPDVIKDYDMKIPPLAIIEKLNLRLAGITLKLEANAKQIRTLTNLRDTLLPKLMMEEVRIKYLGQ